jgi:vacuolar-type H+-ATPase subunit E/Vma4
LQSSSDKIKKHFDHERQKLFEREEQILKELYKKYSSELENISQPFTVNSVDSIAKNINKLVQ